MIINNNSVQELFTAISISLLFQQLASSCILGPSFDYMDRSAWCSLQWPSSFVTLSANQIHKNKQKQKQQPQHNSKQQQQQQQQQFCRN
jgi:hypothetical protein